MSNAARRSVTDIVVRALVRHRGVVGVVWIVVTASFAVLATDLGDVLEIGASVPGSESARVREIIGEAFAGAAVEHAVLVIAGLDPDRLPGHRTTLESIASRLSRVPGVERVLWYESERDSILASGDRTIVLAALAPWADPDRMVVALRAARDTLVTQLPASLTLHWTGEAALNADLRTFSSSDVGRAERRALPVTLLILVLAFGTLTAAVLPLTIGGATIVCSLGVAAVIGRFASLSIVLQSLVTMVGLGLGIDYSLLMVSRFRESMRNGRSAADAAIEAGGTAGTTIAISAMAVMVGFAALTVVPLSELRSLGAGGLLTVLFAAGLSVTLLPGLLAAVGTRIDAWRVLRRPPGVGAGRWRRWGAWVCAHPWRVIVVAGSPLLWLSWHGSAITVGTPREDWLPAELESTKGLRDLETMGRAALLQTVRVVVRLPDGEDVLSPAGWSEARAVRTRLAADPRIASVASFAAFDGDRPISRLRFFGLPSAVRGAYLSNDRSTVLFDALPFEHVEPSTMVRYVNELRAALDSTGRDRRAAVLVGGLPAGRADFQNTAGGWFGLVVLLVVAGTFVGLVASFRSLLIPVKALVLNVLSVAGGFGVVKLVFQDGIGLALLGIDAPIESIFPAVPTLVFCAVFGLSMDYEVFLVSRVSESRRAGAGERDAIAAGLARSAPVITSASAIMVVVFGAFALGDFLIVQILGLALAAAVALDATLVRVAVGPALLVLAGRWNWWPGRR